MLGVRETAGFWEWGGRAHNLVLGKEWHYALQWAAQGAAGGVREQGMKERYGGTTVKTSNREGLVRRKSAQPGEPREGGITRDH